jgi:hypothetical protein
MRTIVGRSGAALFIATIALGLVPGLVAAHEERDVAGYDVEVGLIDEPVYVGERSGLEFFVHKDDKGITGLESTVKAQVIYQGQSRDLPISAREDEDGAYESVFIPTAAGPYTFHLTGTIEGQAIDESFTSSPQGFDEVNEVSSGQFPVQFPSESELVSMAQSGKDAASQATLALGIAVVGVVLGIAGIGIALASRRRRA